MRLLILGPLEGYISTAGKIAIARGATVAHADDIEQGLGALRSGHGADLLMMDVIWETDTWSVKLVHNG